MGVFITVDMPPLSVVENTGFKHMAKVHEFHYNVPSHVHFSQSTVPALLSCSCSGIINKSEDAYSGALLTFVHVLFIFLY